MALKEKMSSRKVCDFSQSYGNILISILKYAINVQIQ